EGVVVEVDGIEVREVEDRGEERGEGFGDFGEEPAGEDVGQVGNLRNGQWMRRGICTNQMRRDSRTRSVFFVASTSPSSLHAPTPSVLPSRCTSSRPSMAR